MASQLSGVRRSMTAPRDLLEKHLGRSAVSHLWIEWFLSSLDSSFVKELARWGLELVAVYQESGQPYK